MKKNNLIVLLVVIVALLSVMFLFFKNNKNENSNKLQASFRFGWIPSASFCGEIDGMKLFAKKHNLDFDCCDTEALFETAENY